MLCLSSQTYVAVTEKDRAEKPEKSRFPTSAKRISFKNTQIVRVHQYCCEEQKKTILERALVL